MKIQRWRVARFDTLANFYNGLFSAYNAAIDYPDTTQLKLFSKGWNSLNASEQTIIKMTPDRLKKWAVSTRKWAGLLVTSNKSWKTDSTACAPNQGRRF